MVTDSRLKVRVADATVVGQKEVTASRDLHQAEQSLGVFVDAARGQGEDADTEMGGPWRVALSISTVASFRCGGIEDQEEHAGDRAVAPAVVEERVVHGVLDRLG